MPLTRSLAIQRLTSAKAFPAEIADGDKAPMLGEAIERLINSGRWKGTKQNVGFRLTSSGELTLPRQYASLQAVKVAGFARQIAGPWYEYLPGVLPHQLFNDYFQDRGDGFCTFKDIDPASPRKLKVTCASFSGDAPTILVQGKDENGDVIYGTAGAPGKALTFGADATSQLFSTISAVVKPATSAVVKLYAVDPAGVAPDVLLGVYEPGELIPSYRRYWLRDSENLTTEQLDALPVQGLCQLQYVEATQDNDVLFTGNIGALKNAILSIHNENIGEHDLSDKALARAEKLLDNELKRNHAPSEAGAVRVIALGGFGASGMHRQPR